MALKHTTRLRNRSLVAVLGAAALLVVACSSSDDPEPSATTAAKGGTTEMSTVNAVTFDTLADATVKITGQGTFIEPGTLEPSESAWEGSGFLIDPSGIAITNNHVVVGAGRLDGTYGENGESKAGMRVLGASECLDLAVVQLNADDLPHYTWYDGQITTGLDVYSAGFPAGASDDFTLTRGIVSKADFEFDTQWASLEHVIEHDARIRGGNSGGPLITGDAQVLGVNYAGDDSLDYNFAIHRDVVRDVIDDMREGKRISSIGVNAQAWNSGDPEFFGVWVSSVEPGGPADKAGIEPGDLILKLGGVSVGDEGSLASYCQVLDTHGSDGTMDVEVLRPRDDTLLTGQINGRELEVEQENISGGQATEQAGEYSGESMEITDDSNSLAVSVPVEWADVDTTPWKDNNGRDWVSLVAAPDLGAFWESYNAPGLWMLGTDPSYTPEQVLEQFDASGTCTESDRDTWDDGYYRGPYVAYDCSGTTVLLLATQDYDQTGTLVLLIQLETDYEVSTVLEEIASTFRFI